MQRRWWSAAVVSIVMALVVGGAAGAGGAAGLDYATYLPVALKNVGAACAGRPTLIQPANGSALDTMSPLYVWNDGADPAATSAHLQLAYDAEFSDGAGSLRSIVQGHHEFRFSANLRPGATVYWRAWMMCGSVRGPYSEVWSFTTGSGGLVLPAPAQVAPGNYSKLAGTQVTLQWAPVPGAVDYLVRWRELGERGYGYDFLGTTQMAMSGLEADTAYEWWVSARNDYAIGTESPVWQFTTGPVPVPDGAPDVRRPVVDESGGTVLE